jgi:trk system potassium uptake protein
MDKVFAVIGLGTFGRQLCATFIERGAAVIAIDNQADLIDKVKDDVTQAVRVDSTDEESLEQVPFDDVQTAIVAIGDNIEASILTTALLKRKGIPYILARAISELHSQVLRQVGADEVVNLEIDEGIKIAQRLATPNISDRFQIGSALSIVQLKPPKAIQGKPLLKLDLRKQHRVSIVAIYRTHHSVDDVGNPVNEESVLFPDPTTKLDEQDSVLVVGKNEDIDKFKEL